MIIAQIILGLCISYYTILCPLGYFLEQRKQKKEEKQMIKPPMMELTSLTAYRLSKEKEKNKMTNDFNFKDFIAHKSFWELEKMMGAINQEIESRRNEDYKDHVKNILTAIQDLIDNDFGNKMVTPNSYTWEELFTQLKEYY